MEWSRTRFRREAKQKCELNGNGGKLTCCEKYRRNERKDESNKNKKMARNKSWNKVKK